MRAGTFNLNSHEAARRDSCLKSCGLPARQEDEERLFHKRGVCSKSCTDKHPIVQAILDYRMLAKLKSTYADGLVKEIADGRAHPHARSRTWSRRRAVSRPRSRICRISLCGRSLAVRSAGCSSRRTAASLSTRITARSSCACWRTLRMTRGCRRRSGCGMDVHTATAAQVFGVEPEQVTPLQRRHAKAVNFGIVYGISEFSLAEDIGVTRKEAKAYIEVVSCRIIPVCARYMHDIVAKAKEDGYVTTLFGRRRDHAGAEELATSTSVRSASVWRSTRRSRARAADIIKLGDAPCRHGAASSKAAARGLILQVHDELIVECPAGRGARQVRCSSSAERDGAR